VSALWRHQAEALDFAHARKRAMLCIPMGGGKSRVAVQYAVEAGVQTVLVLCPVSVIGVWRREFAKHAAGQFDVECLDDGTCAQKADRLKAKAKLAEARRRPLVIVLNYESAWRAQLANALLGRLWGLLILDESHRVKAPNGKASKFCHKLGRQAHHKLALTGTPAPHSPLDLFAQARVISPGTFGLSFTAFRGRYAEVNPMFPGQVRKWLNQEELRERWRSLAYECSLDGVLDLPPVTEQTIEVELGAKARRAYDALEAELWAKVESGEVTVSNALVKLLRLQQLSSGFAQLDGGELVRIDDAKKRALADLLEDAPADVPVAVFCRFRADLDTVRECASACGRTYAEISGASKDALDDRACLREGVQVVGVQVQSGGVGIDLTRAAVAVWFSLGFSLGDYLQARARLHRPGQTRHVSFINLIATGTVDEAVHRALERRQEVIDAVLHGRPSMRRAA
jgi:SNF2 family DNA or RNA helicase